MSDQQPSQQPSFSIEKIYVRDLSVEVPNAPQIYLEREAPAIEVQIQNTATPLGEGVFEVAVTVTVTAKKDETAFFLVEAAQAGIFRIVNVPQADMEPILAVGCPNILFPYARETISDAINRAGFPPVLLAPVNFEALYQQRAMELQAAQSTEAPGQLQ
ncbi:MAG: protein-export chaperone SecB [Betaproteobacteria bacterium HGW-Betaproteobacteria-11]|nr:MAG: protein-export chaperone SecB [Betaproteobacteria bacterium HGW-Betaproteobacteria-11]